FEKRRQTAGEVAAILCNAGANVDFQEATFKKTALMFAVEAKDKEVVKVLVDYGCDIFLQDKDGRTALQYAIDNNLQEIFSIMAIRAYADCDIGQANLISLDIKLKFGSI